MRVLLVCHGYPPVGIAGVERLSAQAAGELIARGHEVTVLTRQTSPRPLTLDLRRETREGVPVIAVVGAGSHLESPDGGAEMERIFERVIVETLPDVVLITHLMHHSPGYVDIAHRWGVPVLMELHDFFTICPRAHLERTSGELCDGPEGGRACAAHCFAGEAGAELRWPARTRSFAEALHAADEALAPSQYVAEALAPVRGDARPIRVVGNAVAQFGPALRGERGPDSPLRLASIGITVEHKGFGVVVEALRLAQLPAAEYTILGLPLQPLARELQSAADAVPGLRLRLAGAFFPPLLPALLAESEVLVVPSLVPETFSIVLREGMACGLPAIASDIGALPAAIRPEENGWLFEPGDATGLALLLRRLSEDRSLVERAAAAIRPADLTSVAERTDRIEEILAEIAARRATLTA